jgi:hypothetical protein
VYPANPEFQGAVEPFLSANEKDCDAKERPGVHKFIKFVLAQVGGREGRTMGPCTGKSGHSSGRAWDWMIDATNPEEKDTADAFLAWLLKNDQEIYRRAGLYYVIWNKRSWSNFRKSWGPYDGFAPDGSCPKPPCRNPHTDHVHFSFTPQGANGKTSFYKWLDENQPGGAEPPPPGAEPLSSKPAWEYAALGFGLGFAAVLMIARKI